MKFDELVEISGDSILSAVQFDGRTLQLQLELEDDQSVSVSIPTSSLQTALPSSDDKVLRTCHLQALELSAILDQSNGYFVPPNQFAALMKNRNNGAWLGYGTKTTDAKYLVSAVGYSRLVSCIVQDLGVIDVKS